MRGERGEGRGERGEGRGREGRGRGEREREAGRRGGRRKSKNQLNQRGLTFSSFRFLLAVVRYGVVRISGCLL